MDIPRVTKREKKLYLTYELSHSVNCIAVCPSLPPNGSTLLLYGHHRGLRMLWKGGKRPKEPAESQQNGTYAQDLIAIDVETEKIVPGETEYEEEEDEIDPDCPYPSIIQDMDIDLGAEVIELDIPALPPFPLALRLLRYHTLVLVTFTNGGSSIVLLPLLPPSTASKENFAPIVIPLDSDAHPVRQFTTAKIFGVDLDQSAQVRKRKDREYVYGTLLVATATDHLRLRKFDVLETRLDAAQDSEVGTWPIPASATGLNFHPSPDSTTLLITDRSGTSRIFDPSANTFLQQRPSSQESQRPNAGLSSSEASSGRWIVAFYAPYVATPTTTTRRKQILAARWALNGRAIFALLEDGMWGMWDVTGSVQGGKDFGQFVLHGFLGPATSSETSSSLTKGVAKLAPMTPNTRKTKAANLFTGPPKLAGIAPHGGISIATSVSRGPQLDESVLIWYNSEVYAIQSLLTFWQRSTTGDGAGFGTLHSPGLTHIDDIKLANMRITSLAQLAVTANNASFGRINTQRDFVLSNEHQIVISQSLVPTSSARMLFQQPTSPSGPRDGDIKMLESGDLDIGGMDRLLDSMANAEPRTRKVGFVQ